MTSPQSSSTPSLSISPIPSLLRRVLEQYHQDKSLDQQTVSWICHDPCLSSHVLRAVNSTLNGFPRQLTSVHQSLKLIGPQLLQRLLAEVEDKAPQAESGNQSSSTHFSAPWRCALKTAVFAEQLVLSLQGQSSQAEALMTPEEAFSAGLLHNIGDFAEETQGQIEETPVLGVQLAQQWNFSHAMQSVIAYHQSPHQFQSESDESQDLVMIIAIAKRFIQDMTLSPAMFGWLYSHIALEEDDFETWRERFIAEAEECYDARLRWVSSI